LSALLAAGVARAAPPAVPADTLRATARAAADSTGAPARGTARAAADSTGAPARVTADTAAADTSRRIRLWDQPRMVMLRSLVVPGWGQVHNHAWLKAVGFAGVETWMGLGMLDDRRALDRLSAEVDAATAADDHARESLAISEYNDRLNRYVGRQWTLAGIVTYAVLDAYVDAHFRNFDVEFRHDPALPPDMGGGAATRTARARWPIACSRSRTP
jgi:hypothetical protein